MHAAYGRYVVDGLESDHHLYGGAVGVGYDVARGVKRVVAVDFGHNQRHVAVHAERARVVNHQRAVGSDDRGKLLRNACAGRSEGHVYIFEIVRIFAEFLDDILFSFKSVTAACRTGRAKQYQIVDGKILFIEHTEKFLTDGAACAYYCYIHC